MPIGSLTTNTPSGGEVAGTNGPSELRDIKIQLRASFPAFVLGNDVCTLTGPELSDAARKSVGQTITGEWNFTSGNLKLNGLNVATQSYVIGAINDQFTDLTAGTPQNISVNWNFTAGLQSGGATVATQTWTTSQISTSNTNLLAGAQTVGGLWNFTTPPTISGAAIATQAWVTSTAMPVGHAKLTKTIVSLSGTGGYVAVTGTTATFLTNCTHVTGNGTIVASNAGTYRVRVELASDGWSGGVSCQCAVKLVRNASTTVMDNAFTAFAGTLYHHNWEDFVTLSASDTLRVDIAIDSGYTLGDGLLKMLVERIS